MAGRNGYHLHIEDVRKSYGGKVVLEDIDLRVREGELCTVVGPSGCGKSTLLRLILGQERPSEGILLLKGRPIRQPGPDRGIVYQKYSLFPHLTIVENIMMGRRLGRPFWRGFRLRRQDREEAMRYLESVRLAGHADKYPHELSGGMQQRVAIAQALITEPDILLMDEPFGALDPGTREAMQMLLLEVWERSRMTVFFVTHDLEEAVFLGTRILVLSQYYDPSGAVRDPERYGARIVCDHQLPRALRSPDVKATARFGELIQEIRAAGFDPAYRQQAREFNLAHPDAFVTLENGGSRT